MTERPRPRQIRTEQGKIRVNKARIISQTSVRNVKSYGQCDACGNY